LIERYQHGFPLVSEPFQEIARQVGAMDEKAVIESFARAYDVGALARIGAVFVPNTVGASTLAALAVPPMMLEAVAKFVSNQPEVNHNYARTHRYNLWFVVTAGTHVQVADVLARIYLATGFKPLNLPLLQEYHIDLGFSFLDGSHPLERAPVRSVAKPSLHSGDRRLLSALNCGLALASRPFAALAEACQSTEERVLSRLAEWNQSGALRRFGCVLRHRELGYRANAMCIWQVAPDELDVVAARLAKEPAVTLCYARAARPPHWPYNLYSMIHAPNGLALRDEVNCLRYRCGIVHLPHVVLMSTRCYTQRAAHYGG
jgi:DNA-binding Lrp family transcriptional regulator